MDLIKACENNDIEKALDLIMNIKQRIIKDDVLLMPLIFELYKVQLKMNNDTNLGSVDVYGKTALIWACQNKMTEVALELIKTGHANFEQVDKNSNTALILACRNAMKEVALELINTGKSNPYQYDKDGKTAFLWACEKGMKEVVSNWYKSIFIIAQKPKLELEQGNLPILDPYSPPDPPPYSPSHPPPYLSSCPPSPSYSSPYSYPPSSYLPPYSYCVIEIDIGE